MPFIEHACVLVTPVTTTSLRFTRKPAHDFLGFCFFLLLFLNSKAVHPLDNNLHFLSPIPPNRTFQNKKKVREISTSQKGVRLSFVFRIYFRICLNSALSCLPPALLADFSTAAEGEIIDPARLWCKMCITVQDHASQSFEGGGEDLPLLPSSLAYQVGAEDHTNFTASSSPLTIRLIDSLTMHDTEQHRTWYLIS